MLPVMTATALLRLFKRRLRQHPICRPRYRLRLCAVCVLFPLTAGCDAIAPSAQGPLFAVPLEVAGESVGSALIDTGGGYEIMLRTAGNLRIVDSSEVVIFAGLQRVEITEGFDFVAGGVSSFAESAIVSGAICDCNGIGFQFFRRTGTVLAIDFDITSASFVALDPADGIKLSFAAPPPQLPTFDSSFIEIELSDGGAARAVTALIDTGANVTVVRRSLLSPSLSILASQRRVTLAHPQLGSISVDAGLFDNPLLPDVVIGTEAMRLWGDRWYFRYAPRGGTITVQINSEPSQDPTLARPIAE